MKHHPLSVVKFLIFSVAAFFSLSIAQAAEPGPLLYLDGVPVNVKNPYIAVKDLGEFGSSGSFFRIATRIAIPSDNDVNDVYVDSATINGEKVDLVAGTPGRPVDPGFRSTVATFRKDSSLFVEIAIPASEMKFGIGDAGLKTIVLNISWGPKGNSHKFSSTRTAAIQGLELPAWLKTIVLNPKSAKDSLEVGAVIALPKDKVKMSKDIPLIGPYGPEFQIKGTFMMKPYNHDWKAEFEGGVEWKAGSKKALSIAVVGGAKGEAIPQRHSVAAWSLKEAELGIEFKNKFILWQFDLWKSSPPSTQRTLESIPIVGDPLKRLLLSVSAELSATPAVKGTGKFDVKDSTWYFKSFDFKLEVKMAFVGKALIDVLGGKVGLEVNAYMTPSFTVGVPEPFVKGLKFKLAAGLKVWVGVVVANFDHTLVDYTYPGQVKASGSSGSVEGEAVTWDILPPAVEPVVFPMMQVVPTPPRASLLRGDGMGDANAFLSLSKLPKAQPAGNTRLLKAPAPSAEGVQEAAVNIADNVSPIAFPVLAGRGNELTVLFVNDVRSSGEITGKMDFAKIFFTQFDGTKWSQPTQLPAGNGASQTTPSIAYDGTGRVVAGWSQGNSANLSDPSPGAFLSAQDAVFSVLDPTTKKWSALSTEASEESADLGVQVSGPFQNGDVATFWLRAKSDVPSADGTPRMKGNYMMKIWNSKKAAWEPTKEAFPLPEKLVSLVFRAGGDKAVAAYSVLSKENPDGSALMGIRYRIYTASTQKWSEEHRIPESPEGNLSPGLLVTAKGDVYFAWNQGEKLVVDKNFSGKPVVVREHSPFTAGTSVQMVELAGGQIALTWGESNLEGNGIVQILHDPATGTWSDAVMSTPDFDSELISGATTDAAGNLTVSYLKTLYDLVPVEGEAPAGPGQPQPMMPVVKQRDIVVAKFRPHAAKAFAPSGFRLEDSNADGVVDPGETVTLIANIENKGTLGADAPQVSFYEGDPAQGAKLIGTAKMEETLRGGDDGEVRLEWTAPDNVKDVKLFAVLTAPGALSTKSPKGLESIMLDRSKLVTGEPRFDLLPDGSGRLILPLRNAGAAYSTTDLVRATLYLAGRQVPLDTSFIPNLDSGETTDLIFTLPSGTVTEAGVNFRVLLDEANLLHDVEKVQPVSPIPARLE